MNRETDYYNQSSLWTDVAEYQVNVRQDIERFIPSGVKTILDVGCGNGYIINFLAERYDCTGIDISETALQGVTCKKMIGNCNALPFPDDSFDLVMINDVIEHLPQDVLRETLAELRRVSARYIIVTVPFMERLDAGMTCCTHCGTVYHIAHHLNSFGVCELTKLFNGELQPYRLVYTGSEHLPGDLMQYELRAALGFFTEWKQAMCPICGHNASSTVHQDLVTAPYYKGVCHASDDSTFRMPLRNECIALFDQQAPFPKGENSGITLKTGGVEVAADIISNEGVLHLLPSSSNIAGSPFDLEIDWEGTVHTLPRPKQDGLTIRIPAWFNNFSVVRLSSAHPNDSEILKYLINLASDCSELKGLLEKKKNDLKKEQAEKESKIGKIYWNAFRSNIEQLAQPDIFKQQAKDQKKHFLVICHDQEIDRRILQQVEALISDGWSGVIVALSYDMEDHIEEKEGLLIHRIGTKHVVPDCKCYWLYQRGIWLSNKYSIPFFHKIFAKINAFGYRALSRLYYQCGPIKYPLPFDLAFLDAATHYSAGLILAEDLPALKAAAILKRSWNCKLVFDSHEFYPEQRVFSSVQKRIMHDVTKRFIGDCDAVITVSDGIAENFHTLYQIPEPFVLHNVTNAENITHGCKFHELLNLPADQKVILYQGGIIPERNIDLLVSGFVKLNPVNTHLVFLGPAAPQFLTLLKMKSGSLLDQKIHFLKAVPRGELLAYTASADFGVIPYKVIDLNTKFCMPNKFFEFIQAGLPILSNNLIELKKIMDKIGGGGMTADLNTIDGVTEALNAMLKRDLKKDHEVLLAARNEFSWDHESILFKKIIMDVISQ